MNTGKMWSVAGALIWLVFKFASTAFLNWEDSAMAGTFLHMLILLALAVFSALKEDIGAGKNSESFLDALIKVLRHTFRYVLTGVLAAGSWYFLINADALQSRKAEQVARIEEALGSDEAFEITLQNAPELIGVDRQTVYENQLETLDLYYSAPFHLGFALLGLALAALIFSLVVTALWRNVWSH